MRQAQASLSRRHLRALEVYACLARRVIVDFHLEPMVFDVLQLQMTHEEALTLLDDLDLIHTFRTQESTRG